MGSGARETILGYLKMYFFDGTESADAPPPKLKWSNLLKVPGRKYGWIDKKIYAGVPRNLE